MKNPPAKQKKELQARRSAIERLADHFDRKETQEYLTLISHPRRLLWVNFLAGMARGIGMMLGGGMIGTLIIGILIGIGAYVIHSLGGLPWIGQIMTDLIADITAIVQRSSH